MMSSQRSCYSCGSQPSETSFPAGRRLRGARLLCSDCLVEWPRELDRRDRCYERLTDPWRVPVTRASYRARLRSRQSKPQGDLIDLVLPVP